jgi:hypothetical protein
MWNQSDGWVKRGVNGVALFALIPACLAFLSEQADPLRVAALGFCLYAVLGCLAVYVCAFGAFSPFI